mgnify:CR=1 FL=1
MAFQRSATDRLVAVMGLGPLPFVVQELLDSGANPNAVNKLNQSAAFLECHAGNHETLDVLLGAGAKVPIIHDALTHSFGISQTEAQHTHNTIKTIEVLLKHGADINKIDAFGKYTPLHKAAETFQPVEIFEFLLDKGADPQRMSAFGETAIRGVCRRGVYYGVDAMIKRGCDHNVKTDDGRSFIDEILSWRERKPNHARTILVLMQAQGLTPMSRIGPKDKTLLACFNDPESKAVIKEAQRAYRSVLMAQRIDGAFDDEEVSAPAPSSSGGFTL